MNKGQVLDGSGRGMEEFVLGSLGGDPWTQDKESTEVFCVGKTRQVWVGLI